MVRWGRGSRMAGLRLLSISLLFLFLIRGSGNRRWNRLERGLGFLLADGSPIDMGFLELPEPVPEEGVLRKLALRIGIDDGLGLGAG